MATARGLNHSMPLIPDNRARRNFSERRDGQTTSRGQQSEAKTKGPYEKLPLVRISKILKKIGAGDRSRQMYIPN